MKKILFAIIIISSARFSFAQNDNTQSQLANEYYINGELEKARDIYKKLATRPKNIPQIHSNYFNTLVSLKDFKSAEKYLKRALKSYPTNTYYNIDLGILYQEMGNIEKADKTFTAFLDRHKKNQFIIRTAAQYYINKELTHYAQKAFLLGRKYAGNQSTYALELASVYRILGDRTNMIEEYLTYGALHPNNLRYVKNIFQNLFIEEEQMMDFQQVLVDKVQEQPNERMYGELLIWVNLQQKNFYGAYTQAKAIDKRFERNGNRVMNIARIALQNSAYDDAIEMFNYVVDNYKASRNYIIARRNLINAQEQKIKSIFPIQKSALRALASDYQALINELGFTNITMEAYRNKALLHAFYLDEKDSAILILNDIIAKPRINRTLKSKSKLDLGDIYLLTGEPWESTLLYSQVEKRNKDSPIGYEAKLKNAKLNYYKGEFELAKSHLDILKTATSREIANDAMELSLLIQANTVLDTSDFVMKEYASIELLLYQNKKSEALQALDSMLKKYPHHTLTDEIHWKMANINMELGKFEQSLEQLKHIQTIYAEDILGDDAMYLAAKIYEEQIKDLDTAKQLYNDFLLKYPGSVFTAEARKRFRKLRGDDVY